MEGYTNERIDTFSLPRFEEVALTPLQPKYYRIVLFNILLVFTVTGVLLFLALYNIDDLEGYWLLPSAVWLFLFLSSLIISRISFKNKGYAFRTHDVIYRSGAIAIKTIIIPYNRVQHVALHEGWLSRSLGLAAVEVFTAGGVSSDVKIPGLEKEHAERIKLLLMGKVLNQQENEE